MHERRASGLQQIITERMLTPVNHGSPAAQRASAATSVTLGENLSHRGFVLC